MTRRTRHRPPPRLSVAAANAAYRLQGGGPRETFTDEERAERDQFAPTPVRVLCSVCRREAPLDAEYRCAECAGVAAAMSEGYRNRGKTPRPREAPTEQAEHKALAQWIRLQWWAKGARRLESQASRGLKERGQLADEGGEFLAGNPDWLCFIPATPYWRSPLQLAVELKRRDAGKTRPRDRQWWLTDKWPWQERGEVENPDGQLYGLRYSQACALRSMDKGGVQTYVAYGWEDAAEWLEHQIGPRPAVEPEWGW